MNSASLESRPKRAKHLILILTWVPLLDGEIARAKMATFTKTLCLKMDYIAGMVQHDQFMLELAVVLKMKSLVCLNPTSVNIKWSSSHLLPAP